MGEERPKSVQVSPDLLEKFTTISVSLLDLRQNIVVHTFGVCKAFAAIVNTNIG